MIYSITSENPGFKKINFKSGFNVILAERTKESTKRDSRNGLGKSTLIEIIHFCLGAEKGETLNKNEMNDWTFILDIELIGKRFSVKRNTTNTNDIFLEGDFSEWPLKPEFDLKTGKYFMTNSKWKKVLGALMFGLDLEFSGYDYAPTFRSLISYFIRRNGERGGFLSPFQQYKSQMEWDKMVNNSFLLDLEWRYASKWQTIKDRMRVLDQLKEGAKAGLFENILGSLGQLEAKKIRLESQVEEEDTQLREFKIHSQYEKIENDVNNLTQKLHELSNQNMSDKILIDYYDSSIKDEVGAQPELLSKVYKEAGLIFPESVNKKLKDVMEFHDEIITNRRGFLLSEIERIKEMLEKRKEIMKLFSSKRIELMEILQSHGALEEFVKLQNRHQRNVAELEELKVKIGNLKKFESGKSDLIVEQETLQKEANRDLDERKKQKEKAVLLFNSNSNHLYDAPGNLAITVTKKGFKFDVYIERSGSHGVGNMKIFCYDMLLAQLWSEKERSPGVLIHDSILFADVDERQVAHSIEMAANESRKRGFQYICTLNSDNIPKSDFSENFKFEDFVVETLTDATDDGGLLGKRF